MYDNNCIPTFLVSSIALVDNQYVLNFTTTPTVTNGKCFKFRIPCNITTVATAGTPLAANVTINGTITTVPLRDCNGNALLTGCKLRTRKCYLAQFGNNTNHLTVSLYKGFGNV